MHYLLFLLAGIGLVSLAAGLVLFAFTALRRPARQAQAPVESFLSGPDCPNANPRVQEIISALVRGKRVLDIGCVEHTLTSASSDHWLHKHVANNAAYVVGLDVLEREVRQLRERGYNVLAADAVSVDLGEKFDVVVAGEIIEHIDNPGGFLRNMARHLEPEGILVITTPYPFCLLYFADTYLTDLRRRWNTEHVSFYCPFTLANLLQRSGLQLLECVVVTRSSKMRMLFNALRIRCPRPLATTMLAVAGIPASPSQLPS